MNPEAPPHSDTVPGGRRHPLVAAALSALIPGTGQLYAGKTRRALPYLAVSAVVVGVVAALAVRDPLGVVKLAFRPGVLLGLLGVDVALLVFRAIASVDAYRVTARTRPVGPWAMRAGVVALSIVLVTPHAWFAYYDLVQYDLISTIFAAPDSTTTSTLAPSTTVIATTTAGPSSGTTSATPTTATTTPTTTTTTLPPPAWAELDRLNVLLLGSDAGVGRIGVRTDTMILASVDPATGDVALFGIPRNLARVPLPPSIEIWDCNCFPPILNELYRYGEEHPDAFPGPATPGANAIKAAVAELLGIPVHYYALVALEGFVDLVDALGGVTLTVTERIYDPIYPKEGGGTEVIDFAPGTYEFDGHDALAFARSRRSSDDYDRMGRQRCVIEGLVNQADPLSLLRGFPRIAEVLKANLETDLPLEALPDLIDLVALVDTERALSLPLIPPTYTDGRTTEGYNVPNTQLIQEHVRIATTLPPLDAMELLGIDPLADACG